MRSVDLRVGFVEVASESSVTGRQRLDESGIAYQFKKMSREASCNAGSALLNRMYRGLAHAWMWLFGGAASLAACLKVYFVQADRPHRDNHVPCVPRGVKDEGELGHTLRARRLPGIL
jgi:hypothetical protein